MKKLTGLLLAIIALAGAHAAAAAEVIKIGSFGTLTGPAGYLGDPMKKVLELYVGKINASGGLLGRQIELITYDDGGASDKAASNVKRLIESDHVDLIIGGTLTATCMAVIPLVERAGIPFIAQAGGLPIIEPIKKWVFKPSYTDRMAAQRIFADMRKRGITKIGMISEDGGFGKSGHDQSLLVAPDYGIEIIADEVYSQRDADVTAQLTKIRNNPAVQAVLNFGFGAGTATVTKNYRQLGLTVPFFQTHAVASKEFIRLTGESSEGVRMPAAGLLVPSQLPNDDPQKVVVTEFSKVYEQATKTEVSSFAGQAYDSLQIALAAIQRAGSIDKAKVRDEIEKTSGYIGTGGSISMSPTDHMGLSLSAFRLVEIHHGDWLLIE